MDFKFIRKIDDLGRIVIPNDVRKSLGIKKGDKIEIDVTDGYIILKKENHPSDYQS